MTTANDTRISRLLSVGREAAIEELGNMADENPAAFLELLGLLLDEAQRAGSVTAAAPNVPTSVTFVIRKQSGSDNQT